MNFHMKCLHYLTPIDTISVEASVQSVIIKILNIKSIDVEWLFIVLRVTSTLGIIVIVSMKKYIVKNSHFLKFFYETIIVEINTIYILLVISKINYTNFKCNEIHDKS